MGNSFKEGKLEFFRLDVGFFTDRKVELLRSDNNGSIMAEYFYLRLLCHMYADKGYYMEWNEDEAALWALRLGVERNSVQMMIKLLFKRSMLNEQLYQQEKVLSSRRIQDTYVRACSERAMIQIQMKYNLLKFEDLKKLPPEKVLSKLEFFSGNHVEKAIDLVENGIDPGVNRHSIVEYSKVDESIGEDSKKYSSGENSAESVDNSDIPADNFPVNKISKLNRYVAILTFNKFKSAKLFRESDIAQYQEKYPNINMIYEIWKMQRWINNEIDQGGGFDKYVKAPDKFIKDKWLAKEWKGKSDEISENEMLSIIVYFENLLQHDNMRLEGIV